MAGTFADAIDLFILMRSTTAFKTRETGFKFLHSVPFGKPTLSKFDA